MRNFPRLIRIMAVLCCMTVLLVVLSGSFDPVATDAANETQPEIVNTFCWNLYGTWITTDGTMEGTMDFPLSGIVIERHGQSWDHLRLDYYFPDDFRYHCKPNANSYNASASFFREEEGYFAVATVCFDRKVNWSTEMRYAIDLDEEYFIIQWQDDPWCPEAPDLFLVASTDPDVDPASIMEHFKRYITALPMSYIA